VSGYSLSETVIRNRLLPIIRLLEKAGVRITLISPGAERFDFTSDLVDYVSIRATPKPRHFFKRAFYEWLAARRLIAAARKRQTDLMVVSIPSMFCFFCMRRQKSTTVLDIRDLTWEYLSGSFLHLAVKRYFRFYLKIKLKYFDFVSFSNKSEQTYLQDQFGIRPDRLIFLPNGVSSSMFELLRSLPRYSADRKVQVSYIGNVGIAQNLKILLAAAKDLKDIQFNIVGDGIELEKIRGLCVSSGLTNVSIVGKVSVTEVVKWYACSDILYAQLSASYSTAMPSKLYEYLATGKRVIYGGQGHPLSLLSDFENHVVIPPDDPEALTAELRRTLTNGGFLVFSEKNKELIKNRFIRETNSKIFLEKLGVIL
jgi:glycosyltransferase involved in cell wall biosynthesis